MRGGRDAGNAASVQCDWFLLPDRVVIGATNGVRRGFVLQHHGTVVKRGATALLGWILLCGRLVVGHALNVRRWVLLPFLLVVFKPSSVPGQLLLSERLIIGDTSRVSTAFLLPSAGERRGHLPGRHALQRDWFVGGHQVRSGHVLWRHGTECCVGHLPAGLLLCARRLVGHASTVCCRLLLSSRVVQSRTGRVPCRVFLRQHGTFECRRRDSV